MVSMAMILRVTANPIAQDAAVRRNKQPPPLACRHSIIIDHLPDDAPDSSNSVFAPHNPIARGVTASVPPGYGSGTTTETSDKPTTTLSHYSYTPPPAESTSSVLTSVSIPVSSSSALTSGVTSSVLSSQTPYIPAPSSSVVSSTSTSSTTSFSQVYTS